MTGFCNKKLGVLVVTPALACLISACVGMENVETYIPKRIENFSNDPPDALVAVFDDPSFDNPRATFWLADVAVTYSLPDLSRKDLSVGVIVPVIPAPTKKVTYDEAVFSLKVSIDTSRRPTRIVSVDPREYQLVFDGSEDPVSPSSWQTSCAEFSRHLEVLSERGCSFTLQFSGRTTENVRSFVLNSAPIAVDDVLFKAPDLEYDVGKYKSFWY